MSQKKPKAKGSAMGEKTRKRANRLSDEERERYLAKAIQVIYRDGDKVCANRR